MGSVNNLSDARFAAGFDMDFIGFCLAPDDERRIPPDDVKEISEWLEGPSFVAELNLAAPSEINEMLGNLNSQWVQIEQGYHHNLSEINGKIFQNIRLNSFDPQDAGVKEMEKNMREVEYFIIEPGTEIDGEKVLQDEQKLNFLTELCASYNVFLDLPFTYKNVHELLEKIRPAGINIKGADEVKPGYRDFDELIDLLEALEQD